MHHMHHIIQEKVAKNYFSFVDIHSISATEMFLESSLKVQCISVSSKIKNLPPGTKNDGIDLVSILNLLHLMARITQSNHQRQHSINQECKNDSFILFAVFIVLLISSH